jgi:UDP-N-acetylglucosamine 2-epimerase (non-hydrolysing)
MPVKIVVVAGARPNFMKVAPLLAALRPDNDLVPVLVHTGQHYDFAMSGQFFQDLGLPDPDYHLEAGSGSHAQQTAEILKRIEPVLLNEKPAGLVVVGDVNSTIAGALAASKLGITVVHVEAGLRSFDRSMPEEINRLATDAITDLFLVTEESGRSNLLREGVNPERIHMIGNLMIDSLRKHLEQALGSDVRCRLIAEERYGLVTLHRPANVDNEEQLAEILAALAEISKDVPLYWPVHPRTRLKLAELGALSGNIHLLAPLGYLDFLALQAQSSVVLTDSGGIQEETTVLGIPCLTLRENTERPVTVEWGTNTLAGTSKQSILKAWRESVTTPKIGRIPPLWDGNAGQRARTILRTCFLETS